MANVQYTYSLVAVSAQGGGDSAPSPIAQIEAPSVLTSSTYVSIAFASTPGITYKILRQRNPTDTFVTLLTSVLATGTTTTVLDQGQFTPQPYRLQRGNEYQLAEFVKIQRVYYLDPQGDAQPVVPTDLSLLSGSTIEQWDQTSGTIIGNPNMTPQYLAQQASTFPVQSPFFARVPVATPWRNVLTGSQNPMYYLRGGYIGILPPDVNLDQVMMDYIPKPPLLYNSSDLSIFPDGFLDALCFKMLEYMSYGDDAVSDWRQLYMDEVKKLRIAYVDTIQGDKPHVVVPLTIRTQMREWPVGR